VGLTFALSRARRLRADAVAVVDGDRRFVWRTFEERVARLAGALVRLGVQPGDRVAILAANSHRHLEAQFAILWAGAVVTPLNHRLTTPELLAVVADAEPSLLLFDRPLVEAATELLDAVASLRSGVALDDVSIGPWPSAEGLIAEHPPVPDAARDGDDLAFLYYTGGTTGSPKGVMLSHRNLEANTMNVIAEAGLRSDVVHLHCGPLFHVAAGARVFSTTTLAGRNVVIPRFDAESVLSTIERERCTIATFVPTMAKELADRLEARPRELDSLSIVTYGAAPMPEETLLRLLRALPGVRFYQSYGQTELSPVATMLGPEDHAVDGPRAGRLVSAGRPVLLCEVRIVDEEDRERPTGQVGEIAVRGPTVMLGYWRQPDATAHALRDGWMHTGDGGYLDADGYLFVVDRLKDMIISGGENVYSIEVENALYRHPGVAQCAVFGVPDPRWGEAVHAVVVARPGTILDEEGLRAHCRDLIAGYKVPKSIELREEPLPVSGANKIVKTALRDVYRS